MKSIPNFLFRYMLDRESAVHVSARLQDIFFIMAVSNSCMDPLVYGSYTLDFRKILKTMRKIFCVHNNPPDVPGKFVSTKAFTLAAFWDSLDKTRLLNCLKSRFPYL